jgi:heme-degrading monooxygenase HmoA
MFVAMNNFTTVPGQGETFEGIWRERDTYLDQVPGFLHYVSHSMWADRAAFNAWTESESFTKGHRGASMAGILADHPHVELFEAVTEVAGTFGSTGN